MRTRPWPKGLMETMEMCMARDPSPCAKPATNMMQSLLIKVAMLRRDARFIGVDCLGHSRDEGDAGQPQLLPKHSVTTVSSPPPVEVPATRPALASVSQAGTPSRRQVAMPIEESESAVSEKASTDSPSARQAGVDKVDLKPPPS